MAASPRRLLSGLLAHHLYAAINVTSLQDTLVQVQRLEIENVFILASSANVDLILSQVRMVRVWIFITFTTFYGVLLDLLKYTLRKSRCSTLDYKATKHRRMAYIHIKVALFQRNLQGPLGSDSNRSVNNDSKQIKHIDWQQFYLCLFVAVLNIIIAATSYFICLHTKHISCYLAFFRKSAFFK